MKDMQKLFYGVGTNSKGKHKAGVDGKITKSYNAWRNMLQRAYCPKYQAGKPTYIGCSVADKWLEYQEFAEWFENHDYSDYGYQLDKDLLTPGNKIYAPDRCVFVPRQLNTLLTDSGAIRGQYPQGVSFHKRCNKFTASININSKNKGLGYFDTEIEAYNAYKEAKERHVKNTALKWANSIQWEVFKALMLWELPEYKDLK